MIAYKALHKDLTCTLGRGRFQFVENEWMEEKQANCKANGFHSAENPLDCLTYYGNWEESAYYQVDVDGDIDEDGSDSKISSTKIKLVKRLDLFEFITAAVDYICHNPKRKINERKYGKIEVWKEKGRAKTGGAVIVYGEAPMAFGQIGSILGMVKRDPNTGCVTGVCIRRVDGIHCKADTWYRI